MCTRACAGVPLGRAQKASPRGGVSAEPWWQAGFGYGVTRFRVCRKWGSSGGGGLVEREEPGEQGLRRSSSCERIRGKEAQTGSLG